MRFLLFFLFLACSSKPVHAEPDPAATLVSCETLVLSTDPLPEQGKPCDVAITPGKVFKRTFEGWSDPLIFEGTKGPKGDPGAPGPAGPAGESGSMNDDERAALQLISGQGSVCCRIGAGPETVYDTMIDLMLFHLFRHPQDEPGSCP